ncbi:MAG: Lrp/AsnC family transcriptional regulator [Deltaproteobacteria bacterium]|nr:Lrp/AsnC family transcriptional regulator [Deltaproteobacteria bacterium]
MDETDRILLNRIQSDLPLTPRPFAAVGDELGIGEDEVIARITRLKKEGIIRRIGGNFVPQKIGYVSTLCAAQVPPEKMDGFIECVNAHPGVTHNYRRSHHYNVWFTFIAPGMEEISAHLAEIERKTGVTGILNLPAKRVFKIKAHFNL